MYQFSPLNMSPLPDKMSFPSHYGTTENIVEAKPLNYNH